MQKIEEETKEKVSEELQETNQESQKSVENQKDEKTEIQNVEKVSQSGEPVSPLLDKDYFCMECRKIVKNSCLIQQHGRELLMPYEQVEADFNKYKLYCEQNDPLFNIAKGLNKIKDSLKFLENPVLQADYQLKQKVFDENSKIEDFIDKIIYKGERLLIDDMTALNNLDQLKKDQYLIDMIQNNYIIIKQFLNKYQQYRYENHNVMGDDLNIKAENVSESSDEEAAANVDEMINQKRKSSMVQNGDDILQKKARLNSDQQDMKPSSENQSNNQFGNQLYDDIQNDDTSKYKKPSVDHEVGLEYVSQKEQEILKKMLNTQYEKHHRFTEQEKKLFAKFALLRKLKGGINVSITTEQWRLNRITVQLWIDKFKKQLKQKHEI
ncbi:hypothetical protein PPERSA_01535 [Pseudocohnilembus persalinus]|uniref:Uncharacterized protein n=1 Tax=Pseudocohnilembus persalinus TaxID=266149 RepID=A0A0V0R7R9_PSEPJ|nr:hypothetical protein PPERSA_01535 [Pseudocohnilembus persalinus]|eukprot:KRX10523.1 hypothetical protein PPERSA_01535 [Pseudocohnilembus persalinus]